MRKQLRQDDLSPLGRALLMEECDAHAAMLRYLDVVEPIERARIKPDPAA